MFFFALIESKAISAILSNAQRTPSICSSESSFASAPREILNSSNEIMCLSVRNSLFAIYALIVVSDSL